MKKELLMLSLLLSTAGCFRKKTKEPYHTAQPKQHEHQYASINIPLTEHIELSDEDETPIVSFFDDELESDIDTFDIALSDDMQVSIDSVSDSEQITWQEEEYEAQFKSIYFDFDEYTVRQDQEDMVQYDAVQARQVTADDNTTIIIEGHACHSAGSPAYNLALSERRAKVVADQLKDTGISQDRIKIIGRGQEIPAVVDGKAVTGSRQEQWPNRRVELKNIKG